MVRMGDLNIVVNSFIYFSVIISGASVLAVELLGTRIIAPFYGVSLYLWSALISVTLAALSAGYAIGGRWADRGPKLSTYSLFLGGAGLWILCVPWLRYPVLSMSEPLGLRSAVLVTATVLFFPPLALLGMVTPYALRLKATHLDTVGTTAGNLYAVSTIASVVAAVATGFFLVPNIGVSRLTFLIGLMLLATAALGVIVYYRAKAVPLAIIVLAVVSGLLFQVAPSETHTRDSEVVSIRQSAYGEIRVVDSEGLRYMMIDGSTHTIIDPLTWDSYFPYVNVLDVAKGFFNEPGSLLLVGLGGGSVVKSFYNDGWTVDAVEIDPVVTETAHEYFGLLRDEAAIHSMDGRQYLLGTDKTYDLIIMDAFGSSSIPFHLATAEAFALIHSHLAPGGLFAMNTESVGWHTLLIHSLAATAGRQFRHVTVLPIAEPPDQLGNLVILASDRSFDEMTEPPPPEDRFSREYDQTHAWDNRFTVDTAGIPVLTDDRSAIDIWAEQVNVVAREGLHKFFKKPRVSW